MEGVGASERATKKKLQRQSGALSHLFLFLLEDGEGLDDYYYDEHTRPTTKEAGARPPKALSSILG